MGTLPWPGPRRSIEALAVRHGRGTVVTACVDLLDGRPVDGHLLVGLGGPPAEWALDGSAPGPDYWTRVWALRGLLWLWDDRATEALVRAHRYDAWRVREMAAKVVARHEVEAALPSVLALRTDQVLRVRVAAGRAVVRLTSGHR